MPLKNVYINAHEFQNAEYRRQTIDILNDIVLLSDTKIVICGIL
jgi:hypothetical protein